MALFKISKGSIDNLSSQAKVDDYAWFTPADGKFYIDAIVDGTLERILLNAKKADILSTSRTINGTSFDGSENITTANWGTARTITIGNASKSVNGSEAVTWSLTEIGVPTKTSELTNDSGFITSAPVTSVNNKTGVGSHSTSDTIWFGACSATGVWIDSYKQKWVFNGSVTADSYATSSGASLASTTTYTVTSGTSWTSVSDYYTQNITVTGLLATDNPIVSIIPTIDGHEDEWSAWSSVFKITTSANTLTLYSDEAIDIALSLQIKVVR